jgi:hypothetical protein
MPIGWRSHMAQFGEKQRNRKAERNRNHHGDERAHRVDAGIVPDVGPVANTAENTTADLRALQPRLSNSWWQTMVG